MIFFLVLAHLVLIFLLLVFAPSPLTTEKMLVIWVGSTLAVWGTAYLIARWEDDEM